MNIPGTVHVLVIQQNLTRRLPVNLPVIHGSTMVLKRINALPNLPALQPRINLTHSENPQYPYSNPNAKYTHNPRPNKNTIPIDNSSKYKAQCPLSIQTHQESTMSNETLAINQLFTVKGKTAVVTGGSRGIGLMIARGYIQNGAKVYISSRKADVCDAVAEELSKDGECISIPADLSNKPGWETLVNAVKEQEDSIDILVNNAGAVWAEPFDDFPESGYDRTLDINLKGIYFLTQMFLPLLEKNHTRDDPARVINIGSIDGIKVPSMDNFPYGPSKAAVHHLTKVLAVRLAPRGIAVNAIAPGPFESKMMEWSLENFKDRIEANCPLGRIGAPEDMAALAIFLASPGASYLNGTVIPLDGGICVT